jgi:hypothetical protein
MGRQNLSTDIRILFRPYDVERIKSNGIGFASYQEVKSKAADTYSRLQAADLPCNGGWSGENPLKFKKWMEGGMEP